MSPSRPTNGELAILIQSVAQELRDGQKHLVEGMGEVKTKLDHTNGRVRKLEQWKFAMVGGLILGNLIIVPIIVQWIAKNVVK